jgi:hypothetical protein
MLSLSVMLLGLCLRYFSLGEFAGWSVSTTSVEAGKEPDEGVGGTGSAGAGGGGGGGPGSVGGFGFGIVAMQSTSLR